MVDSPASAVLNSGPVHQAVVNALDQLGLAVLVKTLMVMHEHFPRRYFKYVLIVMALLLAAYLGLAGRGGPDVGAPYALRRGAQAAMRRQVTGIAATLRRTSSGLPPASTSRGWPGKWGLYANRERPWTPSRA